MGQIVESTHEMLESFRSQREVMRARLRESLARAASLRKCDFDTMMGGILVRQGERERAIKETMRGYLREQREMATALKQALALGETERIGSVKELLKGIETRREERERDVRTLLAEFRREQEEMSRALHRLLSDGGSVRVKEFKATLRAIQARKKEEGGRDGGDQGKGALTFGGQARSPAVLR